MPAELQINQTTCPDCRGRGSILLLIRTVPCVRCAGRGRITVPASELPLDNVDLSVRVRKGLRKIGVHTLGDIVKHTDAELLAIDTFGLTTVAEIKQVLAKYGLAMKPR